MQDLIVYLNKNVLKLTTVDKGEFKSHKALLAKEAVDSTRILDPEAFATVIKDGIDSLQLNAKQKPALNFVLGPSDVILMFVAINKRDGDIDTQILSEVKSRLKGIPLEDLYFSYQKVAPFVYQFVAVFKDTMENYLQVSDLLQMPLKSILPWVLLLPKYVNLNDPAIFVCSDEEVKVVALSEFNGVFFSDIVDETETAENMQKLIDKLSFYKRTQPINVIYTLNSSLNGSDNYKIKSIELPLNGIEGVNEYAINVISNYMLDSDPGLLSTQLNVLNTLPLPVVPEKKNTSLVYVGAAVGGVAMVALLVGGIMFFKGPKAPANGNTLASDTSSQVLSAQEPSQSVTPTSTPTPTPEVKLEKSDLMIRVENGAGITGLAARTKEHLEKAGYRVLPPETADTNRTSTLLKFKKSKISYKDIVSTDIKDVFPNIVVEDTLEESAAYDLLLVAGTTAEL